VLEVSEAQGDPAEVLEAPVDGLDRAVGSAHIEVREEFTVALPQ